MSDKEDIRQSGQSVTRLVRAGLNGAGAIALLMFMSASLVADDADKSKLLEKLLDTKSIKVLVADNGPVPFKLRESERIYRDCSGCKCGCGP